MKIRLWWNHLVDSLGACLLGIAGIHVLTPEEVRENTEKGHLECPKCGNKFEFPTGLVLTKEKGE